MFLIVRRTGGPQHDHGFESPGGVLLLRSITLLVRSCIADNGPKLVSFGHYIIKMYYLVLVRLLPLAATVFFCVGKPAR